MSERIPSNPPQPASETDSYSYPVERDYLGSSGEQFSDGPSRTDETIIPEGLVFQIDARPLAPVEHAKKGQAYLDAFIEMFQEGGQELTELMGPFWLDGLMKLPPYEQFKGTQKAYAELQLLKAQRAQQQVEQAAEAILEGVEIAAEAAAQRAADQARQAVRQAYHSKSRQLKREAKDIENHKVEELFKSNLGLEEWLQTEEAQEIIDMDFPHGISTPWMHRRALEALRFRDEYLTFKSNFAPEQPVEAELAEEMVRQTQESRENEVSTPPEEMPEPQQEPPSELTPEVVKEPPRAETSTPRQGSLVLSVPGQGTIRRPLNPEVVRPQATEGEESVEPEPIELPEAELARFNAAIMDFARISLIFVSMDAAGINIDDFNDINRRYEQLTNYLLASEYRSVLFTNGGDNELRVTFVKTIKDKKSYKKLLNVYDDDEAKEFFLKNRSLSPDYQQWRDKYGIPEKALGIKEDQ
ncbi:MAG TPA: hypothetical protein VFN51_03280 [Candidatus Saccharimonadales bacterium]|nr:hypothetical protein [Candidatus Saccharimonadales bacterium]